MYNVRMHVCLFISRSSSFCCSSNRFTIQFVYTFIYLCDGMCSSFRQFFNSIYGTLFRFVWFHVYIGGIVANSKNMNEQTHRHGHLYTKHITDEWRWIGAASNGQLLYKHYELNFKSERSRDFSSYIAFIPFVMVIRYP